MVVFNNNLHRKFVIKEGGRGNVFFMHLGKIFHELNVHINYRLNFIFWLTLYELLKKKNSFDGEDLVDVQLEMVV